MNKKKTSTKDSTKNSTEKHRECGIYVYWLEDEKDENGKNIALLLMCDKEVVEV